MISSVTFHPFLSHFPTALFGAGILLLWLSYKKGNPRLQSAASFNLSIGFLMSVIATLSGMISADINLKTNTEIEGHQGYSMLCVVLYGFCTGYSYTNPYSSSAKTFYVVNTLAVGASVWSGYSLVF